MQLRKFKKSAVQVAAAAIFVAVAILFSHAQDLSGAHTVPDHVLFVAVALIAPLLDRFLLYPWFQRAVAAGVRGIRIRFYLLGSLTSWAVTGCILALWVSHRRSWRSLLLAPTMPLRLALGFVLVAAYAALLWMQWWAIVRRSEKLERLAGKFGNGEAMMPRTSGERWGFAWLSITAGICEETIYRGYITWYIGVWTGLVPAVLISVVLFGFAHFYQGAAHIVRTAMFGAIAAILVLVAGSLWPAIIVHALQDLAAGDLGFRALRKVPAEVEISGLHKQ